VNQSLPTRTLREHPDLDQLKRQAKELLDGFLAGQHDAVAEVNTHYRGAQASDFALHDAQLVLARAYGFESWPKLKGYVDGVTVGRLAEAVRSGHLEAVRAILKVRPELTDRYMSGSDEHRALHYAVLHRSPEIVRLLMQHGADARVGIHPHRDATSPLTLAMERGYEEIVVIIREEEQRRQAGASELVGVDPPSRVIYPEDSVSQGRKGDPPAMQASQRGEETTIMAFLDEHPELINRGDPQNGMTPLHWAAAFLLQPRAIRLLDRGADVNARNKIGNTPLDIVGCGRGCGKTGTPEQVATMMDLLLTRGAERTARWAIASGNAAWLRARHAEGTLGQPSHGDEGLLLLAVRYDRPEMLALLLDLGFDPDERRRVDLEPPEYTWGQPLRHCAQFGKLEMAKLLLARGADPNAHIWASGTPLYAACIEKNQAMIELLERHGGFLDAECVGDLGLSEKALQMLDDEAKGRLRPGIIPDWAATMTVAEVLLRHGSGKPEILRMALERIDRPRDDPWWFGRLSDARGNLTCLRLVLDRCGPNVLGAFGRTILHDVAANWCSSEDRVGPATMLLNAGARLDARDDLLESTPLGWACRWGRAELVKLYLRRGADPIEADAEPWATPRAWAEKMKHTEVLTLLREHEH
jgi:ankyrin repeat protein